MNTREIAAEYRLAHWAQIMRERQESGQSIKAYCENAGIHANVFYYWQRKLREAACEQMMEIRTAGQSSVVAPGFAEVRLEQAQPVLSVAGVGSGQLLIEVSGLQITAESGYPPEKLAQLLRELVRV